MNILFISKELIAGHIAYLLRKEGHSVKLYIEDIDARGCFDNLVDKTDNWENELSWVGTDGLIVFDDTGYAKIQDELRSQGYTVFGGSVLAEKLETNREYGQKIFQKYGLSTVPLKDFKNLDDAIVYAQNNPRPWVVKRNGKTTKFLTYVSRFDDGRDAITLMKNYLANKKTNKAKVSLHERVDGIEMGIARYFNGTDWVGPIEYNIEHTPMMPGNIGPITSEMGTVAWYGDDENNKLFKETLEKMKPFLKKACFKGDFSLNCIVNEQGAFILEATSRLGSPIIHLQTELHQSPWGEFLRAVARGESYNLSWKRGYGIVVLVAVPPFPYLASPTQSITPYGIDIHFKDMVDDDHVHVHFDEIAKRPNSDQLYIADNKGYVCYATAVADSVESAQDKVYGIIRKIVLPRMIYRNDIGSDFDEYQLDKLREWGYA
ncbi:MAG: hypothetical protein KBC33_03685 [Candidatus Pacebacteria bacterium]|nr:hypothetical protein [Candidatus Paceibacterota bacterium]